jgi:hypothetical protein
MWGSNGEFMMRKRAVDYYGSDFMNKLNQMRLPRFAGGGDIGVAPRPLPLIPSMPTAPRVPSMGTLNLMVAGERYELQGDNGTIEALLKAGKRYGLKKG